MTVANRWKLVLDADCDVAAMVYGPHDDPDSILRVFLRSLLGMGYDAVGVVQERSPAQNVGSRRTDFVLLPEMDDHPLLVHSEGAPCDTLLLDMAARLSHLLKRRPDLMVLNRYGSQEMAGAGLMAVIAEAVRLEVPILIAVPEALFPRWLDLVTGLTVRVGPSHDSLSRWWQSLGRPVGVAPATACERFK